MWQSEQAAVSILEAVISPGWGRHFLTARWPEAPPSDSGMVLSWNFFRGLPGIEDCHPSDSCLRFWVHALSLIVVLLDVSGSTERGWGMSHPLNQNACMYTLRKDTPSINAELHRSDFSVYSSVHFWCDLGKFLSIFLPVFSIWYSEIISCYLKGRETLVIS